MSFKFGPASKLRLATCDRRLQAIAAEVIKSMDVAVLCGHRGEVEQTAAVRAGLSKAPWPTSKHNAIPSRAVDLAPYPVNWSDTARFESMAGLVLATAKRLGVKVRWGADWNMNGKTEDERFRDWPHFELVED